MTLTLAVSIRIEIKVETRLVTVDLGRRTPDRDRDDLFCFRRSSRRSSRKTP